MPLFVRDGHDVPEGNRELIERGGRAVNSEELASSLATILDAPALRPQASVVRESPSSYAADHRAPASLADGPSESAQVADLFPIVWPRLAGFLSEPRTETEVADAFHLQKAQTKAWLQRALDEGLVRKLSKPTRFERIHAADDSQASLFEP